MTMADDNGAKQAMDDPIFAAIETQNAACLDCLTT
jgi:hypothetical protein